MVKQSCILIAFIIICSTSFGQRLNFGINGGWTIGKTTNTQFDNEPFQFLYAAPYSSEAEDEYDIVSPFDQVRLARIYGIQADNSRSFRLGGSLNYQLKNDLRFRFEFNFQHMRDRVYYGFQNIVINVSDQQDNTYSGSADLLDDNITIKTWGTTYQLNVDYDIPIKSVTKPFVSIGYLYNIQVGSDYESNNLMNSSENDSVFNEDFQNTRIFQDKLFNELSNNGINHFINFGVGARRFGLTAGINMNFSIGPSTNDLYFINQRFTTLFIRYDILSIPLFK